METLGLVILASLFVLSGINHIRNHAALVGYTRSVLGDCPVGDQIAWLGGAPTGLFLAVFGAGLVVNEHAAFAYGLAGFLAVATALFHRNFLKDPGGFKGVALIGALLYIGQNVV